jgi:tRNA A-37 threonylcarbamoyl transferase component Bud32
LESPLVRKLEYQDGMSAAAIWFKAVLLTPLWGIAAIPALGSLAILLNDPLFYTNMLWQASLGLVIAACLTYFIHDLRKRVIYVSKDQVIFGLRRYQLNKLVSVGVEYKSEQLMPRRVLLRFRDGGLMRLKVGRLHYDQFESLLHFVETRLPQVQIDPVLLTLMRCRRAAGKAISDTGESVEIRYESQFVLKELRSVFARTWDEWSSFGPLLLSALSIPCWTMFVTMLYMLAPAAFFNASPRPEESAVPKLLNWLWQQTVNTISHLFTEQGRKAVVEAAGNPITVVLLSIAAAWLLFGLARTLLRPNRIIIQSDSIRLIFRLSSLTVYSTEIPVRLITGVRLFKRDETDDPSSWKIRFEVAGNKPVDLAIAALSTEEKTRLTRAIQRLAPQIPIDAALLETLIPRQDRSYTELWLQSLSSAPERKSLEPLQPGQLLGSLRYQVSRCLGVGGQGTAYLARDTGLVESRLSEMVVLKESIFPVYAESSVRMQALERFEKEASLLSRLEHPGIVSLRDYFLEDHRGYLVMEHVEGKTLKQLVLEEGPLAEMPVRDLAQQMCDILAYLHASGVVHRDFTPDNLILSKSGQLKLIDFNVAQQMEAGSSGTIVGKQAYLPPEQFRGKATTQSDLYALGATLYFLLTGEDPEPICQSSPLQKGASCSQSLDQIIRDCTALQLGKRIATAGELNSRLLARTAIDPTTQAPAKEAEEGDTEIVSLKTEEELVEMESS